MRSGVIRAAQMVLKSRLNPVTGVAEWVCQENDYDFHQETARAGYADMLHDQQRNVLYEKALKNVISETKAKDGYVHVMDIGTGTGLLAMMAARAGADRVTAVEIFEPMAAVAKNIIKLNGYDDKISLITQRSTDMTGEEMDDKANVLVAEVFDTELIGEGALRTFTEAHERLLKPNSRVIPASGRVFVQPIQSSRVLDWKRVSDLELPQLNVSLRVPPNVSQCAGAASVHDVQLDQLPQECFLPISEPIEVFNFDFQTEGALLYEEQVTKLACVADWCKADRVEALLMWWQLDMDGTGDVILSTEPNWRMDQPNQWRDHWMQAVYYLPRALPVTPGQTFELVCSHDEFSLWFEAVPQQASISSPSPIEKPICTCGLHVICSRSNIGRMNDPLRQDSYARALLKLVAGRSVVCVSDCSWLPLLAAQLGATRVTAVESNRLSRELLTNFISHNNLEKTVTVVETIDDVCESHSTLDLAIGEPFFFGSIVPWHDLHFWYAVNKLKEKFPNLQVFPQAASLWCLPIELDDLWKIRAPVGNVEGFDLTPFDQLIQESIRLGDALIEPQPLWEYPSKAVGQPTQLLSWDLNALVTPHETLESNKQIAMEIAGCNALAFWMEWKLDAQMVLSSGLLSPCAVGRRPEWDWYSRQGVFFVPHDPNKNKCTSMHVKTKYVVDTAEVDITLSESSQ